jgi:hypothetical protein
MSVKGGDKIKILKNNPQEAGSVKKGDVATVKNVYSNSFTYYIDGEATTEWLWRADYDQEGKTWEKVVGKTKASTSSARDESFWADQVKQAKSKDKTFKVGERVVVYDSRLRPMRQVATLTLLRDPNGHHPKAFCVIGVKRVDYPSTDELILHPKQVRKIKK